MTLIVETGDMPPNANSYATLAQADAWFANIGDLIWPTYDDAAKEAALIKGAIFCNNQQVYPFNGYQQTYDQAMPYPRHMAAYWGTAPRIPDSTIPQPLIDANIAAAGLSASGDLPSPTPGFQETKREKVDVIEVEYFHSSQGREAVNSAMGPTTLLLAGHPVVTGYLMPLLASEALTGLVSIGTAVSRGEAARRAGWYRPARPAAQLLSRPVRQGPAGPRMPLCSTGPRVASRPIPPSHGGRAWRSTSTR